MIVILYLMILNVITFILFGIDKKRAIKDEWRIPEATLMGLAALGGSVGAFAGMEFFRHKTKHKKFKLGIPALIVIHIGIFREFFM